MLRGMVASNSIMNFVQNSLYIYLLSIFLSTHIVCVCMCVVCVCGCHCLSMGTKFVNKVEIVRGTRSENSVTLHPSSLRVFIRKYIVYFKFLFLLYL